MFLKTVSSEDSQQQPQHHKRTKRVSECEIGSQLHKNNDNEEEEDPVITKLNKIGCLEKHYQVQDCYFETKDWRKCTKEVKEFQECVNKAKKQDK